MYKPEIILIDGYNKSLFVNVFKLYLKKINYQKKDYHIIEIEEFTNLSDKKDFQKSHINIPFIKNLNIYGSIYRHELIYDKFVQHLLLCKKKKYKFIFIFNKSRIVDDYNENYNINIDQIYNILLDENVQRNFIFNKNFFLKKENYLFKMNDFLCSIRIHNIDLLTNIFVPIGGFFLYNFLNCKSIEIYYKKPIYQNTQYYKQTNFSDFFKQILKFLDINYDEVLMKSILQSYLFKKNISSIFFILFIFIIRILFFLPYYIFFIIKIKNKKIKIKNKFFLFLLLLLPISFIIIPSWCLFFIPEIINFLALYKLYKNYY